MPRHLLSAAALALGLCAPVLAAQAQAAAPPAGASGSPTLDTIRQRGLLTCGISGTVAGFALPDSKGVMQGLDADTCRVIAAAALGDASKVKFVPTTIQARFTALQSGEIDVLVRGTTWTLGREAQQGLLFTGVNFYDGTGFLVKKAAGVASARKLDGAAICVQPGTSTELAISDYFRANSIKFTPVEIQDVSELRRAFLSGRCDAYSTDASALASFRATQTNRDDFVLLPEIISKEPLGPMVRKGDDKWFDLVRWALYAQLTAEEDGVTSQTVDGLANSTNPDIRRLLGLEGDMGKALGVDNGWARSIIKQVGNFGEMWDRDITPLGIPRGINQLWNKGGLMYPPPIR